MTSRLAATPAVALAALVSAGCPPDRPGPVVPAAPEHDSDPDISRMRALSVAIYCSDSPESRGSGVVVAPTRVLTAAHVTDGLNCPGDLVVAQSPNDGAAPVRVGTARVLRSDKTTDLALLRCWTCVHTKAVVAARPPLGSGVYVVGYPTTYITDEVREAVTRGVVVSYWTVRGSARARVDAAIHPGNSGGPVFDRQGRVVGVAVAAVGTPLGPVDGFGIIVPGDALAAWLARGAHGPPGAALPLAGVP